MEKRELYHTSVEISEQEAKETMQLVAYIRMVKGVLNLLAGWYSFSTNKPAPTFKDMNIK